MDLLSLLRRIAAKSAVTAVELVKRPLHVDSDSDPYHLLFADFFSRVAAMQSPRVLEIGSRARSGNEYRGRLPAAARYTGLDVVHGPNVDVVGDAHELRARFGEASFDAVFCVSVLEHLAMPWKAALEINAVLREGGLAFVATHPTWPPHELPWDFFRFNKSAFSSLFNRPTGFQLERVEEGLPCRIVPLAGDPPLQGLWRAPAFLGIAAIARKIGPADPRLSWPVALSDVIAVGYPAP